MENLKTPELPPEPIDTKTLGRVTLDTDHYLTPEEMAESAKKFHAERLSNIGSEIKFHTDNIIDIEHGFAKQIEKDNNYVTDKEFEIWENEAAHEYKQIESEANFARFTDRQFAEYKQDICVYYDESKIDKTVEAYAGNFYLRRSIALRNAIKNAADKSSSEKENDLQVINNFPRVVSEYLTYVMPVSHRGFSAEELDRQRTEAHNEVIDYLNDLNSLAKEYGTRPFTPRNFWTSRNQDQTPAMSRIMRYDRKTVVAYLKNAFSSEYARAEKEQVA